MTSSAEETGIRYCCEVVEDLNGVGSAASACLDRTRRFGGGVRVRSTTSRPRVNALKGRSVRELGVALVSLGRFRDMVWVGCFGGGDPLEISSGSSSSMTINFGETHGLHLELEAMGARFIAKGNAVC